MVEVLGELTPLTCACPVQQSSATTGYSRSSTDVRTPFTTMNSLKLRSAGSWAAFAFSSGLTALARESFVGSKWYYACLAALMTVSLVLAARLLGQTGPKPVPIAVVAIGTLLGQWWFVEALILRAFWSINGFAP